MSAPPDPRGPRLRAHGDPDRRAASPAPATRSPTCRGVRVGHATVWRDEPDPPDGRGVARTGVTAIAARPPGTLLAAPVPAGVAVLNGAGEMTGFAAGPRVGRARDADLPDVDDGGRPGLRRRGRGGGRGRPGGRRRRRRHPGRRRVRRLLAQRRRVPVQVEAADAGRALARARRAARSPQGAVGAGTGMVCFGWKGGIGTREPRRRGARRDGRRARAGQLRRGAGPADRRRAGRPRCWPAPGAGPRRAGGELHRRRRDRRAARRGAARAARAPRRPRPRPHRLGRPPRQRRDLPRVRDGGAAPAAPRGRRRRGGRARRRARSRSSPRPSRRPRRRCSTRSGPPSDAPAATGASSARCRTTTCSSCSRRTGGSSADGGVRAVATGRAAGVSARGWRHRFEDTRLLAAVLCVTWGLMFVVQRVALEESPPLWVAAGRASVGGARARSRSRAAFAR